MIGLFFILGIFLLNLGFIIYSEGRRILSDPKFWVNVALLLLLAAFIFYTLGQG